MWSNSNVLYKTDLNQSIVSVSVTNACSFICYYLLRGAENRSSNSVQNLLSECSVTNVSVHDSHKSADLLLRTISRHCGHEMCGHVWSFMTICGHEIELLIF